MRRTGEVLGCRASVGGIGGVEFPVLVTPPPLLRDRENLPLTVRLISGCCVSGTGKVTIFAEAKAVLGTLLLTWTANFLNPSK